jgi:Family of unknown function (DUF6326)
MAETTRSEERGVDTRAKLAAAWGALVGLYIYADFLSLYRPGQLDDVGRGDLGPFDVSQGTLLIASLIVLIPIVMILLSLLLPPAPSRPINLVLAVVYTLVNISNLVGESWAYYLLFGVVEIAVTLFIFVIAWRWRPGAATP